MPKKSVIAELRDRGVIRVAGFYIAVTWLSLQIADVLFPAFDIPDSVLRYVLYVAAAGFPVVCVLAWVFEITPGGIVTEDELQDTGASRAKPRGLTIATIVALILALGTSLYVNFRLVTEEVQAPPSLMRILIANFDNETGDSLFDGTLESALAIGMEGAPFISAYSRDNASRVAEELDAGATLTEQTARLISAREGIDLVLAGTIRSEGSTYTLTQQVLNPINGSEVTSAESVAEGKAAVLPAVGSLAAQIREALGDISLEDGNLAENETLSTRSLAALQHYTQAQSFAFQEQNARAIEFFEKAVAEDPEFGRAYSGWALSELKLGRRERSAELWDLALAKIGGTSERERYRTLGVYYAMVAGNQRKAIESYEALVAKYPADTIGYNNLGVAYFLARQFDKALELGQLIADRFPGNSAFRTNYALYAMYAGDFAVAKKESEAVLKEAPDYFLAYMPRAMAHMAEGNFEAALAGYQKMQTLNSRADSMATLGIADLAMLRGDYEEAVSQLESGIVADGQSGNSNGAAGKSVHLAQAVFRLGQTDRARELLAAIDMEKAPLSQRIPAALLYVDMAQPESATMIAEGLGSNLQSEHRAAADLIRGAVALAAGDSQGALDALNSSLQHSDTWLARYYLGRVYASSGYPVEALGEFQLCLDRVGETTAMFLDDMPSFHYHAPLYYWLGRTREAMGMSDESRSALMRFLSLRLESDSSEWVQDARTRLGIL